MRSNPTKLLQIAEIKNPLIGFYDVPDTKAFEPFAKTKRCFFSAYENWMKGEYVYMSEKHFTCRGGGYWIGGTEGRTREQMLEFLTEEEGLKASKELMNQWLDNQKPYIIENGFVVIGPLKDEQYDYLKTITFFVNPDQLSLLLLGTEYNNANLNTPATMTNFGSGCGQMAALFDDLNSDIPKAIIGATDIAMREHLPPDILALTINKPMYEQLCELDENSFLYKPFWERLKEARR
ncbi:DUF169 domain-containing protein [Bacteroidota bacterium]